MMFCHRRNQPINKRQGYALQPRLTGHCAPNLCDSKIHGQQTLTILCRQLNIEPVFRLSAFRSSGQQRDALSNLSQGKNAYV